MGKDRLICTGLGQDRTVTSSTRWSKMTLLVSGRVRHCVTLLLTGVSVDGARMKFDHSDPLQNMMGQVRKWRGRETLERKPRLEGTSVGGV